MKENLLGAPVHEQETAGCPSCSSQGGCRLGGGGSTESLELSVSCWILSSTQVSVPWTPRELRRIRGSLEHLHSRQLFGGEMEVEDCPSLVAQGEFGTLSLH